VKPDQENTTEPLIAICMASFNPDIPRFRRQIESLIAQTHRNWICIISDDGTDVELLQEMKAIIAGDDRLHLFAWPERVGFYRNFERGLELTSVEAHYIALADQDDVWRPQKLQLSLETFDDGAFLVYCDLRIVKENGDLISPTFWKNRKNNLTDLGAMLAINCVPGAGALFRRSLLDLILPFPEARGQMFHDHWIGLVALAAGKLRFCKEPLYDWIQHSSNVIGFIERPRRPAYRVVLELTRKLCRREGREEARSIYHDHSSKIAMMARTLDARAGAKLSDAKRRQLKLASGLGRSFRSVGWLIGKSALDWRKVGVMNNTGYYIAFGALWRRLSLMKSRQAGRRWATD
jgi:glycosyltransferase involved in cell wall biosynthesis